MLLRIQGGSIGKVTPDSTDMIGSIIALNTRTVLYHINIPLQEKGCCRQKGDEVQLIARYTRNMMLAEPEGVGDYYRYATP